MLSMQPHSLICMTDSSSQTPEQGNSQPSPDHASVPGSERLAEPSTAEERAASWKAVSKLQRGNRLRLMYGLPLLNESMPSGELQ